MSVAPASWSAVALYRFPFVCHNPMRVIAVIDDPKFTEKILRHLGAWHDPPAGLPTLGTAGVCTYEPCDDVDPTPDYENVLTD